jgi:hypothetical protein
MRVLAIILSPILSVLFIVLIIDICHILNLYKHELPYVEPVFIYLPSVLALLVQLLCVEPALFILKDYFEIDLKFYLILAFFTCIGIGIVVFTVNYWTFDNRILESLKNALGLFFSFLIYSIGNATIYNYLYFRRLEKE